MPNTLFITPGPIEWASSRMRAHWVAEHMDAEVIEFDEIMRTKRISPAFENYIFIKTVNVQSVEFLRHYNKRIWWDICDPLHWFEPELSRKVADLVDGIVVSNQGLKADFEKWSGKNVKLIPDRLKLENFKARETISTDKPLRFIWFGAGQNRHSVISAFAYLERLKANGVDCILTIMDDGPNRFMQMERVPIVFAPWELAHEAEIIRAHDIAILPPYEGPWGKVKSNNRQMTAAACGVVLTLGDDWEDLWTLATKPEIRKERTEYFLQVVREDYDVKQSAQEWKELLDEPIP